VKIVKVWSCFLWRWWGDQNGSNKQRTKNGRMYIRPFFVISYIFLSYSCSM